MDSKKVVHRGGDGLYALCFMNRKSKSEHVLRREMEQFGEVVHLKELPSHLVFVRFHSEDAAQKCLSANPYMNVADEKAVPQNGRKPTFRREDGKKKMRPPPDIVGGHNGLLPLPADSDRLSQGVETVNTVEDLPCLTSEMCIQPPKQVATDVVFANFPRNITRDDVVRLVSDLCPLKVGGILSTNFNEPYCHVYLTDAGANAAVRDYNGARYGRHQLVVAPAVTLISEAKACQLKQV